MNLCVRQILTVELLPKFKKDYDSLDSGLQRDTDDAIRDLMKNPIPSTRRLHALRGYKNPKIFTIDVRSNKSYKMSLEINGTHAILRRVATHKTIDYAP